MDRSMPDIADPRHNHAACIATALKSAEHLCSARGVRLTPLRRQVLEQIWQSHEAIKAYDLIHQLSSDDHTVKPPTVYRVLEFLLAQGLIHRIESLNGYVGCTSPEHEHDCLLLICRRCGVVTEMENTTIKQTLEEQAHRQGFQLEHQIMEGRGLCAHCREQ
ncbi:transcriptional repressor [Ectothiorhodospira lacustris]|uniref:transcriptional repressor n=1 Tax=Ectothiorhodospira lacustris TaxID=2899127 RepID=UPI001EE993A0|nr:transcriptional repressor [Ectothiorhodospira lacustris]MCG5500707.1 transcriptional repressor [Ectothiorhodospira lacustris]MCG5509074.1 transcriptional repressor [Ectothiorhodospira lacustris]MCG5520865.1 transcriptional repressor [Ectothiorhodospira lacustris]